MSGSRRNNATTSSELPWCFDLLKMAACCADVVEQYTAIYILLPSGGKEPVATRKGKQAGTDAFYRS